MPTNKIVSADGIVCLVGGAPIASTMLKGISAFVHKYIAVDAGADHLLLAGIDPVTVIGDLDSLSDHARATFGDRLCHISEQSTTDFEKAVSRVAAPAIIAVGFTGGRIDHLLAVLNVIARHSAERILLLDQDDVSFLALDLTALSLPKGCRVSFMPLGRARVTATGVKWPLSDRIMEPVGFISSSNAASGGPIAVQTDGPLLISLPQAHLEDALKAVARAE
ncbi:thiamine diphosphokinase [Yoonia sp. 2307UL14-13]|uniref:thiamine diphosphokinase n=1 Tax=Yoonia sp. 2307UL14-13 TaxID=3126506 RepID=UPI0030A988D6